MSLPAWIVGKCHSNIMKLNRTFIYAILCLMPLFFSTNLIFGRATVPLVEPWTLAFLRWSIAFLILLPFCWSSLFQTMPIFRQHWATLILLGFLGMWICGAVVYFALKYTTATNGTLIYTTSPIIVVILEWQFRGRKMVPRELIGILLSIIGIFAIVFKGSLQQLLELEFSLGDLLILVSAISFALYSLILKREVFSEVPSLTMFAIVSCAGAITLLPFAVFEIVYFQAFPTGGKEWLNITGMVFISSILAFLIFQIGVKHVGPSLTSLFMYLLPLYGVGLSVIFLNESIEIYHIFGSILIISGVITATLPKSMISSSLSFIKSRLGN